MEMKKSLNMLLYFAFFAALALSYAAVVPFPNSNCGDPVIKPHVGKYIVGGQEAIQHSWPWMVHLLRFSSHICGGSLISNNYVVTAAHCMDENRPPSSYSISLGSHKRTATDPGQITVAVASYTLHRDYSGSTFSNDIAIVQLAQSVTYNDHISPVCINDVTPASGEYITVTGWGTLSSGGSLATNLMEVQKPIVSTSQCNQWLPGSGAVNDNTMICAGYEEGGKDSCQGDSGGPMTYYKDNRYFLTGIVSWGYGCAAAKRPGVYTKVSTYNDWIKTNSDL